MNPMLILAVVIAFVANGFYWHAKGSNGADVRWTAKIEKERADASEQARATEREHNGRLQEARNEATTRETKIRTVSAAADTANDRLRDALNTIRSGLPSAPADAASNAAGTLADLLGVCAGEYRGVAEKADRHASDARTLSEAWPR